MDLPGAFFKSPRNRICRTLVLMWLCSLGCRTSGVPETFETTVRRLDTPEKLADWMDNKIILVSKYGAFPGPQQVQETFRTKRGNCADVAALAFHVLAVHGYGPHIMTIQVSSDIRMNHALCVFFQNGGLYALDNGKLRGPYRNLETIASNHHQDWSEYHIYNSLENFIVTHVADVSKIRNVR